MNQILNTENVNNNNNYGNNSNYGKNNYASNNSYGGNINNKNHQKTKASKPPRVRNNSPLEIKGIVIFFAVAIIIYGIVLASEGVYGMYRKADDEKPENIPTVKIGRINDKAIISVQHNVNISKLTYSWDNGEKTVLPIGTLSAEEEITLLGHNSTLYITIEDINRKTISYEKQFLLDGVDITKPIIEDVQTQNGSNKMIITAKDETALKYISYRWEGEEEVILESQSESQTEMKAEVTLTPGTKKIIVKAEDTNGNITQKEQTITASTAEPEMSIIREGNNIYIHAKDKDGVKDISVNINGKNYELKNLNMPELKAGPIPLVEGNNDIKIEVINTSGYSKKGNTQLQYAQ